jgi:hypothetical protein
MVRVTIDTCTIVDWESFHDTFSRAFGFPGFYGRNMNAWVDCLTSLDDPNAGMTTVRVPCGEVLILSLSDAADLARRCPDIYNAIVECSAFVNYRRLEQGHDAVLALSFYK